MANGSNGGDDGMRAQQQSWRMPTTTEGVEELAGLYGEAVALLAAIAQVEAGSIAEYMRLGQEAQRQARDFMRRWQANPHTPKLP